MVENRPHSDLHEPSPGYWWLAAGALVLLVLELSWLNYSPLAIRNDATQSISVARHLADGQGARTGIIYYGEQYATRQVPAPQTVFPPGYPALIALVSLSGLSVTASAGVVVTLSLAAIGVLLLITARQMGTSFRSAVIITCVWYGCVQVWILTRGAMSEMPFIAFTLLSLLLFSHGPRRSNWLVFASGCAAAMAFSMRYAGVFWFITVAAFYAVSLRDRFWINLRSALVWGSVPFLTVGSMFWRNQQLSGEWTGGNAIGSSTPLSDTLMDLYHSCSNLVGWSQTHLLEGKPAESLLLLSGVGFLVWGLQNCRHLGVDRRRLSLLASDGRMLLSLGYVVATIALLIILDARTPIGLGARKLLPLLPFALLAASALLESINTSNRRSHRKLAIPAGLLLASLVLGQINIWRETSRRPQVMAQVSAALQTTVEDATLKSLLRTRVTNETPLLTNEPHCVGHLLEAPVLGLPSPRYTDLVWTTDEVHQLVTAYGVRTVTLFENVLDVAEFHPPFFAELARDEIPPWLRPTLQTESVRCFEVIDTGAAPMKQTPSPASPKSPSERRSLDRE